MKIVILGGGIIGVCTAYSLAMEAHKNSISIDITIVESNCIASAASGKAGGFLAKKWCDHSPLEQLAHTSFDLHMQLASKYGEQAGYRKVSSMALNIDRVSQGHDVVADLSWVDGPMKKHSVLSCVEDSAQVHPYKLCHLLLTEAKEVNPSLAAVRVLIDTVDGLHYWEDNPNKVKTVKLTSGEGLEADAVLIAMGPWSHMAKQWLPNDVAFPNIHGQRGHSIIIKAPDNVEIGPKCIFLEYRDARGVTSAEVYPRPDGSVYVCGSLNDNEPTPVSSRAVKVEKKRCTQLREIAYGLSSHLEGCPLMKEQACYLPISQDNIPVIGAVPKCEGVYVATGHSCWGILNAPGTGQAMAELVLFGKATSVNLDPFDPKRFC